MEERGGKYLIWSTCVFFKQWSNLEVNFDPLYIMNSRENAKKIFKNSFFPHAKQCVGLVLALHSGILPSRAQILRGLHAVRVPYSLYSSCDTCLLSIFFKLYKERREYGII